MAQPQRRIACLSSVAGLLFAATIIGGCRPAPAASDTAGVLLAAHLRPALPTVGPATLVVTLSGATAATLSRATVDVVGHMTHPGMTPVVATVTRKGPGLHEAALHFTMAGEWVIVATARFPDARRVETRVPVRVQPGLP